VKIKSLSVQGFRGFNAHKTIEFHPLLTLISGRNSYGKTSISECLEWLIYGETSKVRQADSTEEYKGSYRNRHFDSGLPFVEIKLFSIEEEIELQADLNVDETQSKRYNGTVINDWPFAKQLSLAPPPFILQHSLKELILAPPSRRFEGFAKLLGLESLEHMLSAVIQLCTKPDNRLPRDVIELRTKINSLKQRAATFPALASISKNLKQKKISSATLTKILNEEVKKRYTGAVADESVLPRLLAIRDEAISKIFSGTVVIQELDDAEKMKNSQERASLIKLVSRESLEKAGKLSAKKITEGLLAKVEFFELGIKILGDSKDCPFCGRQLDEKSLGHIENEHGALLAQAGLKDEIKELKDQISNDLSLAKSAAETICKRYERVLSNFTNLRPLIDKLKEILDHKYPDHFKLIDAISMGLDQEIERLKEVKGNVLSEITEASDSVESQTNEMAAFKSLGETVLEYEQVLKKLDGILNSNKEKLSEADKILKHELEARAGVDEVGLLIELLENTVKIEKASEIEEVLANLKTFRKEVEQFTIQKMVDAISTEFSTEVMNLYEQIRTTGDPDVHFAGFDAPKNQDGSLKKRVQIKATSYGEELHSAVSSLSESKLNALGLCLSLATNLKMDSPFEFLVIDDPIQSWDVEHEEAFIDVIQSLIEKGRQVILLSHNETWLRKVRKGCRDINGSYYEITNYTKEGPDIVPQNWVEWKQRLDTVDALIKSTHSNQIFVQLAEQEMRQVLVQLTCEVYKKKTSKSKNPNNVGEKEINKMLTESGIPSNLVNNISQAFVTIDDAHHTSDHYVTGREKVKRYHSLAHELAKYTEN